MKTFQNSPDSAEPATVTSPTVAASSPFPLRLLAYSNERFPLWQVAAQIPMFAAAFFAGQLVAGREIAATLPLYLGFIAFAAYTFMVRVIDDHKDREKDDALYPHRVLQRGIVTYTELRVLAGLCLVWTLVASIIADGGLGLATMWWFIIVISNNIVQFVQVRISTIGRWLEERRVLLALTVIPFWGLGSIWVAQMGAGQQGLTRDILWVVLAWCVAAFLLEIARKSREPEDEREDAIDYTKDRGSWTRSLGPAGTVVALLVLALLATLSEWGLLAVTGRDTPWAVIALWVVFASAVGAAVPFAIRRLRDRVKNVADAAAGVWLFGQIIVAVALVIS